ncbi:acetyl-CoA carboxylase biotin carboxyl carrier protein [bacterium]|nr:acetyl-CoA carboxylase biotin carboxyl carrier protein [bacterium]
MDLKEIKRLIEIVEEAKISHFNIEVENMKIEIKKEFATAYATPTSVVIPAPTMAAPSPVSVSAPAPAPDKSDKLPKKDDKLVPVKSQMVGTFYSASGPDSPAFVKVGDRVNVGQVLCIIEAMKLFNEIESDIAGTVETICVDNATPVEYGQDLFLIRIE